MQIGIDLDDVLADTIPALIRFHNETYGTSLEFDKFSSIRYWEVWGGTYEEAIEKTYAFHKSEEFRNIQPVAGSQQVVSKLKKQHSLYIITSRQDELSDPTFSWLNTHFPHTFSGAYFTNCYSRNGQSRKKSVACNLLGVELLIEDNPEYAVECQHPGRRILLYDRPWNRKMALMDGTERVSSWSAIAEKV